MSQVTQPGITLSPRVGSGRAVWIAVVVAVVLGAGFVLALTLSSGSDSASPNGNYFGPPAKSDAQAQVAARPDGGPSESGIAAAVGTPAAAGPQESHVAAAIHRPLR